MRTLAILTVRNEAAFLLEWLAHHRAVGFTDFLVFSNDCQDGTDAMLDHLQASGWLTHIRNDGPYDKRGIQFTALKTADASEAVKAANWILTLDIDEFVNIHVGDHTLTALRAALPDATAITLTWRLFGNANIIRYSDDPVTETFTKCAPDPIHWPWRAVMFKTLYRNDGTYRKLGVHRPRNPVEAKLPDARWFDGHGRELDETFKRQRIFSNFGQPNYGIAQLNHYPLGSMESYLLKSDRGRVNHSADKMGMDYWVERNFNTETDTSVLSLKDTVQSVLQNLREDPVLQDLHNRAVAWRQHRFAEIMQDEPMRALFARLLMTPQSRPISPSSAKLLTRYAMAIRKNGKQ